MTAILERYGVSETSMNTSNGLPNVVFWHV
jgi:hypothetical protein